MSPRLAIALDQVRRFAMTLHGCDPEFGPLFGRAFSEDPDRASTAIPQLEQRYDPALAAIAWSVFWLRQGELFQAQRELEVAASSGKTATFWGGMAVLVLGEVCLELGEEKKGAALLQRAGEILGEPLR